MNIGANKIVLNNIKKEKFVEKNDDFIE